MKTNIMIFSPHPDDAEIAIGGFILKQCEKGFGKGIIESNINSIPILANNIGGIT